MTLRLLTKYHFEFLSLKEGCTGSSESHLSKCQIVGKSIVVAPFTLLVRMRQTVSFRVFSARLHSKEHLLNKHKTHFNGALPKDPPQLAEEYIRKSKKTKNDIYIAFLDAKSAFDVFDHVSLMWRCFHIGIDCALWYLIQSLISNAQTVVRWLGQTSESFYNQQRVRQGGILSTNMYKVDLNQSLNRISETREGGTIGSVASNPGFYNQWS